MNERHESAIGFFSFSLICHPSEFSWRQMQFETGSWPRHFPEVPLRSSCFVATRGIVVKNGGVSSRFPTATAELIFTSAHSHWFSQSAWISSELRRPEHITSGWRRTGRARRCGPERGLLPCSAPQR